MTTKLDRRAFLAASTALAAGSLAWPGIGRAATPFTMQAAWVNDAEFMGYFIGIDNGYYAEEGLDLTYLSGGPDVIPERGSGPGICGESQQSGLFLVQPSELWRPTHYEPRSPHRS